jgi:hypothetical protein
MTTRDTAVEIEWVTGCEDTDLRRLLTDATLDQGVQTQIAIVQCAIDVLRYERKILASMMKRQRAFHAR